MKPADAEALYAAIDVSRESLRRRMRWVCGVTAVEDCLKFILECRTSQVYGIFESKTGGMVGIVSIGRRKDSAASGWFSGWIRSDKGKKGYFSDSGTLAIRQAFRKYGMHRLYARIDPNNRPARKALQKLGFRYEGCLRRDKLLHGLWINQECWGLLKSEWKNKA
ncbi:MAG: hypothetical protein A3J74_01290 [Elusimicrobia bacterium RIFCSPHIGHO2_02_FULL_57_9]|nr:MAG: hypothetical protein A3J74_01290 [Elusimicrobia bacterium RIFCSPHIGHO2_02_FULL_57_9]